MAINKITGKSIKDVDISASDLAPGTITTDKIAPGTIAADRLAGGITNTQLAGSIANAKLANSNITINGTAINLGASGDIVAGTDWQAVTVADGSTTLTAEAGKGYFLDTNAGVIEVFLPTSPSRGDTVVLADYAGHFNLNNCIVNTGTRNLDSTTTRQYKITTNDTIAELVYVDAAKGWITKMNQAAGSTPGTVYTSSGGYDTIPPEIQATGGTVTTSGDYKIHTFTGDGNFVVSAVSSTPANNTISYMVIGGGGGSGSSSGNSAGGGGAGGFREGRNQPVDNYTASPLVANSPTNAITVSAATYPITVGGGGAGAPSNSGGAPETPGTAGSNSVFSTITSAGGGFGAGPAAPTGGTGGNGGSGGGGGGGGTGRSGGSGNTPPVSPAQGTDGGDSPPPGGNDTQGGGGGGAGQAGQNAASTQSGGGGDGSPSQISGSAVTRAGGGAGGSYTPAGHSIGSAGAGGGGGSSPNAKGDDGTANTGGGAGGPSSNATVTGATGGKGVVIIRYKYQ